MTRGDRGQGYTLEAIVAAVLLLAGLVFALQSTAVTPLSASTSSQHIENQQQATASGALRLAEEDGSLRKAILNWNGSGSQFYGATGNETFVQGPGGNLTAFTRLLCRTYDSRGIVYNVEVSYQTRDGSRLSQSLVYRGAPSDNAVRASRIVTIYDDDPLYNRSSVVRENNDPYSYDDAQSVYVLDEAPILNESVENLNNGSYNFTRGVDYRVIDDDGDGKRDAIDWSLAGETPADTETFRVDYTPAVDGSRFYAADVGDGGLFNVIRVEVVVWRQ